MRLVLNAKGICCEAVMYGLRSMETVAVGMELTEVFEPAAVHDASLSLVDLD